MNHHDLRVLFVLYESFDSNSAVHVHYLATHLKALGCDCYVAVPELPIHIPTLDQGAYRTFLFSQISELKGALGEKIGPDIIHAWTPRENIIRFVDELPHSWHAPRVVHLEDDEAAIFRRMYPSAVVRLARRFVLGVPPTTSHPAHASRFVEQADGVTVIVDSLRGIVPSSKPVHLLEPGVDFEIFHPMPCTRSFARAGSSDRAFRLGYTGNVHKANRDDVAAIYAAASKLSHTGRSTTVLRTGRNLAALPIDDFDMREIEVPLGYVDYSELPKIMACADLLIQPGGQTPFDERRLPSKLPEYLAMGKPVLLPATNLGSELTHGQNAYVYPQVGADEIIRTVAEILENPDEADRIGQRATTFARRRFNWDRTAAATLDFYQMLLETAYN